MLKLRYINVRCALCALEEKFNMWFWIVLLIGVLLWVVISIASPQDNVLPQKIDTNQRVMENERKKTEYFNWLNEKYSPSKILSHPFYSFDRYNWEEYERQIVAINVEKRIVIFQRRAVSFDDIINCELITSVSQNTTTTTEKDNGIGRAVVGGILAGGAGAIVGATTANSNSYSNTTTNTKIMGVKIYVADINSPEIIINRFSVLCGEKLGTIHSTVLAIIASNKNNIV